MSPPQLVFWRDAPVDVEASVFEFVESTWGAKVTFVCENDYSSERAQLAWRIPELNQVILKNSPELRRKAELLIAEPHTIHIFNGFRGGSRTSLMRLRAMEGARWGILAERPTEFDSTFLGIAKTRVSRQVYKHYCRQFRNDCSVFFAMGRRGVDTYARLGFSHQLLFPFMYGIYDHVDPRPELRTVPSDPTRFIYVGRLDQANKGVDMLLEAFMDQRRSDFRLDIVGGYGDMLEEVQDAARQDSRITFLGIWEPHEVVRNMSRYDVCVVPSRYDGWNVIVNQAINAGLGCIVTDGATSDELVEVSGAGIVIPRNDQRALNQAVQEVLDAQHMVEHFKRAALAYRTSISPDVVGQYMIDVLRHVFDLGGAAGRPICPWLEWGTSR
ncbi:glycosyltransferase family 4 protein [Nocardioides szechwanensis]|uniref:glycosyltransferase family 4 protein n=1 Tax=Nocardioides szechwanensis TaxID=1005944 RepID=UPI000B86C8A9|nr:glycosyltransferase family 4 protein [Nocardioides szechwanensis]